MGKKARKVERKAKKKARKVRRESKPRLCPKCHQPITGIYPKWVYNHQKKRYEPYLYACHKVKQGNKWINKWCYIGRKLRR